MKTIFITGSTDGIGKLAAIKLAKENHDIILHGRNSEKLKSVITEVIEVSNNSNIKGFVADFSDQDDVQNLAEQILLEIPKIDVLINNAGVYKSAISANNEGIDLRIVVNYLAPYLLTKKLFPLLEKTTKARIINLSSAAQSPVSLHAILGKESLPENLAYSQSKLALTMWSFDMAKKKPNINVIAVNPGSLLDTKMVKEAFDEHWSSADKGANILFDLAVSEEYNYKTGLYFDNDKGEEKGCFAPAHAEAYDLEKIEALINTTDQVLLRPNN
jgi:NAD(P)-dependent dehydrogenase (short-subunit alcohol dehydrogenase family)